MHRRWYTNKTGLQQEVKMTHQVYASRGRAVERLSVSIIRSAVTRLFQHVQLSQHADIERTLLEGGVEALISKHHVIHLEESLETTLVAGVKQKHSSK